MVARGASTQLRYRTLYEVTMPDGSTSEHADRAVAEAAALAGGGHLRVIRRSL